jgi:hypothetical protein
MISATGKIPLIAPVVCPADHYCRGRRVEAEATSAMLAIPGRGRRASERARSRRGGVDIAHRTVKDDVPRQYIIEALVGEG